MTAGGAEIPELDEVASAGRTALYRLYGADDLLLYIGISDDPESRFGQHAGDKDWWPLVKRRTVVWYQERVAAETAETIAIGLEQPVHNKAKRYVRLPEQPFDGDGRKARPRSRRSPKATAKRLGQEGIPSCWPPDMWCRTWWDLFGRGWIGTSDDNGPDLGMDFRYTVLHSCPLRTPPEAAKDVEWARREWLGSGCGRPMLVGGFVRDAILKPGTASKDVDVEVYGMADPDLLAVRLGAVGKVTEAGKAFGVLKVRAGDTEIDVSLPRRESKTGAGHRGFAVIPDGALGFAEASARRDFTLNSLMADPETGEIVDCHGGVADLRAGVLRHTSAAFAEDPLRVLRTVQFAARFGFRLAPETAALCRSLADAYAELPVERVWCEMEKIGTRGTDITAALSALAETGWERHFPQIAALYAVEQDPQWHPEGNVHVHAGLAGDQAARLADDAGLTGADRFVIVMAALLHDLGKVTHTQWTAGRITSHGHAAAGLGPAGTFLRSIGCPEVITGRILPLVREHMCCVTRPTKPAVRRLARRLVPATLAELTLVAGADQRGRGDPEAPSPAEAWLELGRGLSVQERPAKGLLTGDHLIAAGMMPGPAFKPILAGALAAQDAGEFEDEAGALAWFAERRAS